MTEGNSLIHQVTRLKIMTALNRPQTGAALGFTSLKAILQTADGNPGTHLEAPDRAGYIASEKRFVGRKPQTRLRTPPSGRDAFAEHVACLREIIHSGADP